MRSDTVACFKANGPAIFALADQNLQHFKSTEKRRNQPEIIALQQKNAFMYGAGYTANMEKGQRVRLYMFNPCITRVSEAIFFSFLIYNPISTGITSTVKRSFCDRRALRVIFKGSRITKQCLQDLEDPHQASRICCYSCKSNSSSSLGLHILTRASSSTSFLPVRYSSARYRRAARTSQHFIIHESTPYKTFRRRSPWYLIGS
jgi:hypothetical protein